MRKLTAHSLLSFTFAAIVGSTFSAVANANPVKILPIGDSITQGTKGEQSYRKPLTQELDLISCSYEMVGSRLQTNRPSQEPNPVFESPHEGYSGHAVDDFLNATISNGTQNPGINSIMDSETPDVILLHIGSNDMTRSQPVQGNYNSNGTGGTIAEIDLLATRIWNKNPNAEILIANVIPWFGGSNNPNIGSDVEDLGDAIEAWVTNENDSRLHLVDARSNYLSSYMNADGIHPNQNGDAHIADAFLQVIEDNSLCPEGFPPATFISSPSVAGELLALTHTFTGTATDQGGSGFDRVRIAIEDDNHTDNTDRWYNFSAGTFGSFDSKNATLTNVTTASLDWEVTATMPGGGSYTIYALAIDNEGNQDYDGPPALWPTNRRFTVANDTTPPNATISNPASSGDLLPESTTISGTASDVGGSGFDSVEIAIRTTGANSMWYDFNGGFSSNIVRKDTTLSNTTNISTDWTLPVTLPPGDYRVQIVVFDGVRNNSGWITKNFVVAAPDTTDPSGTITNPVTAGAVLPSNSTISGTASDTGGSGFDSVEVAIRTTGASSMWYDFNGGFGTGVVRQQATLSNNTGSSADWALPVTLPPGTYRVQIVVFDGARNNSGWIRQDFVVAIPDTANPAGSITNPATAGETLPANTTIGGTATDSGGSGFDSVEVAIRRLGANTLWYDFNGGFSTTVVRRDATLSNTTTSSTDWTLPVNLPPGDYRVQMVVFDGVRNNSGWVRQDFTVAIPDSTNPTGSITSPASDGDTVPLISILSGTAADSGGSGFDSIEIAIRTTGVNSLWYDFNGGFTSNIVRKDATLSNTTNASTDWSLPVSLPAGNYRVQIVVFDGVRNNSGWIRRDFVVSNPDTTNPTGAITNPAADGDIIPPVSILSGTAGDLGGSGFDSVEVAIRTIGANSLWYDYNGGFSFNVVRKEATLSNTSNASTDWAIPISLPQGNYRAQIVVFDGERNNSGWIRRDFTVQ